MKSVQYSLSPEEGKRLIAKGIAAREDVLSAARERTVLVVAGTTNACLALELLRTIGDTQGFDPRGFYRGVAVGRGAKPDKHAFIGDVLIRKGQWIRNADVYKEADEMTQGDIMFKGANAVNLADGEAGVLIGNPKVGTSLPILSAYVGRRVKLIIPVGVEKRVEKPIRQLAALANGSDSEGTRLLPLPGEVYTELTAIRELTGVQAEIMAGGGVLGAQGACVFICSGDNSALGRLRRVMEQVEAEEAITY
jgi:hypothetical protein